MPAAHNSSCTPGIFSSNHSGLEVWDTNSLKRDSLVCKVVKKGHHLASIGSSQIVPCHSSGFSELSIQRPIVLGVTMIGSPTLCSSGRGSTGCLWLWTQRCGNLWLASRTLRSSSAHSKPLALASISSGVFKRAPSSLSKMVLHRLPRRLLSNGRHYVHVPCRRACG